MTDNRTTELRISEPLRGFIKHQSNRAYIDGGQASWLTKIADEIDAKHEQAVAATLGSDDEYEAKMDALLCRLTKGKWSKSRSYDLDFMVSCVEEEFEAAELENGTYKRIAELEELIRIMWLYLSDPETEFPCCIPVCERLREDMRALGLEVDNDR